MIVGVVAYNRPRHLELVLQELCRQAGEVARLYIFCDGPKTIEDGGRCAHVRTVAHKLLQRSVRKEVPFPVHITEYDHNWGLKRSIIGAMDHMLLDMGYDDAILLEDDCLPGPYFLPFMRACLDKYRRRNTVLGISGYTVPIPQDVLREYPWSVYFMRRIGSWGWATWRDRWELLERDLDEAVDQIGMLKATSVGRDMVGYIAKALQGLDVWTPNWQMTALRQDAAYLYPTVSHINNIGFDGSGICGVNSRRYETPIAREWPTKKLAPAVMWNQAISAVFREYYPV